jgi:hypothetical protein
MLKRFISTFIAIAMIAAVFLAWTPKAISGGVPQDECVEAVCACASKYFHYMRNVECNCFCECEPIPHQICEPVYCSRGEREIVLQPWINPEPLVRCTRQSCNSFCGDG